MADTDDSQASGSDYPDAQDLIHIRQKEPYKVHVCATSTKRKSSQSQKSAAPEESSLELNSICKSPTASAVILLDSSDSEM